MATEVAKTSPKTVLCPFPYLYPESGCTTTYSEVLGDKYVSLRYGLLAVGSVLTILCLGRLWTVRHSGSRPQMIVFPFLMASSSALVLRAVDPGGYSGNINPLVDRLVEGAAVCYLYTSVLTLGALWSRLLGTTDFAGSGAWRCTSSAWYLSLVHNLPIIFASLMWVVTMSVNALTGIAPEQNHQVKLTYKEGLLTVIGLAAGIHFYYVAVKLNRRLQVALAQANIMAMRARDSHLVSVSEMAAGYRRSMDGERKVDTPSSYGSSKPEEEPDKTEAMGRLKSCLFSIWNSWHSIRRLSRMMFISGGLIMLSDIINITKIINNLKREGVYDPWMDYQLCVASSGAGRNACTPSFTNTTVVSVATAVGTALTITAIWNTSGGSGGGGPGARGRTTSTFSRGRTSSKAIPPTYYSGNKVPFFFNRNASILRFSAAYGSSSGDSVMTGGSLDGPEYQLGMNDDEGDSEGTMTPPSRPHSSKRLETKLSSSPYLEDGSGGGFTPVSQQSSGMFSDESALNA